MGFLFGLFLGAAATGGGGGTIPSLGSIPFRCLAAFEISEAEYRDCRRHTLRNEIYVGTPCGPNDINKPDGACSFDRNIAWEIAGLRSLKQAAEAKQAPVVK